MSKDPDDVLFDRRVPIVITGYVMMPDTADDLELMYDTRDMNEAVQMDYGNDPGAFLTEYIIDMEVKVVEAPSAVVRVAPSGRDHPTEGDAVNPKIELPTMAPVTEWSHDAYPRQRELARAAAMDADPEGTKTTYTQVGDRTERVSWRNAKGEGFDWVQSWPCPLEDAPKIGDSYRVLHDEWVLNADADEYDRTIHRFELLPEEAK